MANSISYASAYKNLVDKIFKMAGVTSILEAAESKYRLSQENAKTIYLKNISADGMGDYSRTGGYVGGNNTVGWTAYSFSTDRGRSYNLDAMDAKEAQTTALELMAEIMRTNIVPEIDAYRISKICSLVNSGSPHVSADLTYDTVVDAIDVGTAALNDNEVEKEGRLLYVSNSIYELMKKSGEWISTRYVQNNNGVIDRSIETFDGMQLIQVPSARFYNSFTFYDGASVGETAGGFTAAGGAKALNFMIVPRQHTLGVIRHMPVKLIPPALNQSADAWFFAYRLYHDLFIPTNKVGGFYVHSKA